MKIPAFDQYLEYRQTFAASRELAEQTLAWAEPLARQALGVHAQRDQMEMGDRLHTLLVMTSAENNGGWGELMPVWFKPYERPLPIYVLDNWAMMALLWQYWLGEIGPDFNVENLLKIFVGGDLLIPFLPKTQGGGGFLQHGAFPIFLAILWLEPDSRNAFMKAIASGARRFAGDHNLRRQEDLRDYLAQVEFEAFFIAEGSKIGGEEKIRAFLADESRFQTYAALFGGLCFSLAALYDWYGTDWAEWIFQKLNLDYRLARFSLDAWANWLDIPYVEPPADSEINNLFRGEQAN
ncbi:MAG: hypothetical protein ACE5EY_01635 [Anaerolineae bacterium]